ncbi:uncharacterized protein LOC129580957 isoform X2 [Paramacrobiotus metropolitanus]|uniref:uncharacterized protein LOC129580957 isoform X2 n=1 Tax=Paramacrobiotus metropolitanus TaxID=2943436 RepID=UPI002445F66B|nr:uncharacterized protein LOC129580957 isoform X2 [Paramacrobiotus metropolitanus]
MAISMDTEEVTIVSQILRRPKKDKLAKAFVFLQSNPQEGGNLKTSSVIREVQSMGFNSDQILNALVELEMRENNPLQELTIESLLQLILDLSYSSDDFQHVPENETTSATMVNAEQQTYENFEATSDICDKAKDCIICMEEPAEMAFIPCGHIKTCTPCSDLVMLCPVCRKRIRNRMRIYF